MTRSLFLLLALLWPLDAWAVARIYQPECPVAGHATCSDRVDNDGDGTVDEAAPAAQWSEPDTGVYRLDFVDSVRVGSWSSTADATSLAGNYLSLTTGAYYNLQRGVACGSFTNGTYYLFLRARVPSSASNVVRFSLTPFGQRIANSDGSSLFPQKSGASGIFDYTRVGSGVDMSQPSKPNSTAQRTFALNGTHCFHFVVDGGVHLDQAYLSTNANFDPSTITGGGGGGSGIDYEILKTGGETITNGTEAVWANVPAMPGFSGFGSAPTDGIVSAKALWEDTGGTDILHVLLTATDDALSAPCTTADGFCVYNEDYAKFAIKNNTSTTLDANSIDVAVNNHLTTPAIRDVNYPSGVETAGHNAGVVAVNSYSGGLRKQYLRFNLANVTENSNVLCNAEFGDKDATTFAYKFWRGDGTLAQGGICKLSSTTVAGGAPPASIVVSNPASTNVFTTTADVTADVDQSGATARVRYGTVTKTYTQTSPTFNCGAASCVVNLSGLTGNVQYFAVIEARNGTQADWTTSSEVSFTTLPNQVSECTHFASATGTGNGLAVGTPFKIFNFLALPPSPGDILCLADGTYTGPAAQIAVPSTVNGTAGNPITIKATNDGAVYLNASGEQFGIVISGNYIVVEGVDVANPNYHVVRVIGSNNIIRRTVAWNTGNTDFMVWEVGGTNNLVEDIAGFGQGRKIFHNQGGTNTVFRRCWGRWEKFPPQSESSPRSVNTLWYNAYNGIYENCIGTNTGGSGQDQPNDAIWGGQGGNTGSNTAARWASNTRVLGSIAYAISGQVNSQAGFEQFFSTVMEIDNSVSYFDPTHNAAGNKPFSLNNPASQHGFPAVNLRLSNSVGVGPTASGIHASWTQTNVRTGSTIAAAIGGGNSMFNEVPGICKRYQNGVLTDQKLWPWPMDQRIKDAIARTSYPAVNGTDGLVTTTIAGIFGTIPAGCTN